MGGCNQSCPNHKCKSTMRKITKGVHVGKLILFGNITNGSKRRCWSLVKLKLLFLIHQNCALLQIICTKWEFKDLLLWLLPSLSSHMDVYSYTIHTGDEHWQPPLNIVTILVNNSLRNFSLWVIPPTHYWATSLHIFSFCFIQPTNLVNQLPHGTKVTFNPVFVDLYCRIYLSTSGVGLHMQLGICHFY